MFIDAFFAILMIFACIKGIRKGLIVALFSIIAFIVGLAAALKLSAVVAAHLSLHVNASARWLPLLSFMLVFLAVVILVNLLGKLIQRTFEAVMLGWVNRLGGMLLYILLYSIIFSIFLFYAVQLHFIKSAAASASYIYPFLQPLAPKVMNAIGDIIPLFKDMFSQLQAFFAAVPNKIQH